MQRRRTQAGTGRTVPLVAAMASAGAPPAFSARQKPLQAPKKGICRRPLSERKQRALVLEQEPLHVQPTSEAGQRTVGTDHAMARKHDRNRVGAVGRSDGTSPVAAEPEASRLLAVADR